MLSSAGCSMDLSLLQSSRFYHKKPFRSSLHTFTRRGKERCDKNQDTQQQKLYTTPVYEGKHVGVNSPAYYVLTYFFSYQCIAQLEGCTSQSSPVWLAWWFGRANARSRPPIIPIQCRPDVASTAQLPGVGRMVRSSSGNVLAWRCTSRE